MGLQRRAIDDIGIAGVTRPGPSAWLRAVMRYIGPQAAGSDAGTTPPVDMCLAPRRGTRSSTAVVSGTSGSAAPGWGPLRHTARARDAKVGHAVGGAGACHVGRLLRAPVDAGAGPSQSRAATSAASVACVARPWSYMFADMRSCMAALRSTAIPSTDITTSRISTTSRERRPTGGGGHVGVASVAHGARLLMLAAAAMVRSTLRVSPGFWVGITARMGMLMRTARPIACRRGRHVRIRIARRPGGRSVPGSAHHRPLPLRPRRARYVQGTGGVAPIGRVNQRFAAQPGDGDAARIGVLGVLGIKRQRRCKGNGLPRHRRQWRSRSSPRCRPSRCRWP